MAKFCPECGLATEKRFVGGKVRDACPDCTFVEFARTAIGVGALVLRGESVLLVERRSPHMWTIPSGYIEQEDDLLTAVVREVQEEAHIHVQPRGLLLVRNMHEYGRNDIYNVFLCEADEDQQPQPDHDEALDARFVHPNEFATLNIEFFSRWLAETYLAQQPEPLPLLDIPGYDEKAVVFANFTT